MTRVDLPLRYISGGDHVLRQQAMSDLTRDKQFKVIRCSESVKTLNLRKINLRVI